MNPILQAIVNSFTNRKLKKIVNVYKLHYRNGSSPGFGDYLRGCFLLLQISYLLNIEFDLDVSQHPLSKYIEPTLNITGIDYNTVDVFSEINVRDGIINNEHTATNINIDFLNNIISHLNSQNCETFGLFSNAFPCFNIYSQYGKNIIKSKLRPNKLMIDYIDITLNQVGLSKKGYDIIHVRTGDNYLANREAIKKTFINKIYNILKRLTFPNKKYLILSDCNILKKYLKKKPNFYVYIREMAHLGGQELKYTETNGVMNTMLDFFLIEHSNSVLSLSVYGHISGFSKYASIINNIPFAYVKI